MKKTMLFLVTVLVLTACQHQLHFPERPPVVAPHEKLIIAVVITDPNQVDYDSLVFRYSDDRTREIHYTYGIKQKDSVTRTYYYDAAGRLSKLEDENAIYFTNSDKAKRINFIYDASGVLQQTKTDFATVQGVTAFVNYGGNNHKNIIVYDTNYMTSSYNLDWVNRIIYSNLTPSNYLVRDSAIFLNTTTIGLVKTIVNDYNYAQDSSINLINSRTYYNNQLSENGTVLARSDRAAPVYKALRKKLYRNLANWFDASMVWQNDNYNLFPLPGGPYQSILHKGFPVSPASVPYTRDYEFDNSFNGDQLNRSVVQYTLMGQGSGKYITVLRFYYQQ